MIKKAGMKEARELANLAVQMWTDHDPEDMAKEFRELVKNEEAACFIKYMDNKPVAFAQCQLRHDYVEGADSSPVGYLEGIFVREEARGRGVARALLRACESWASDKGCREFASDCELDNAASLAFHLHSGFTEMSRIICFVKPLKTAEEEE